MLPRAFVHDANQCLHVIRLAAESLEMEQREGRLNAEKLGKRLQAILSQVDTLSALMEQPVPGNNAITPPPLAPQMGQGRPIILVAEDEVLAALMLAEHLQLRGFDVRLAHDGEQALELCRQVMFDAVITDIRMPKLDGHELIRQLDELQPGTPVIVASGHIRDTAGERFPDNVVAVVGKPFSPSRISEILSASLPARVQIGD